MYNRWQHVVVGRGENPQLDRQNRGFYGFMQVHALFLLLGWPGGGAQE